MLLCSYNKNTYVITCLLRMATYISTNDRLSSHGDGNYSISPYLQCGYMECGYVQWFPLF